MNRLRQFMVGRNGVDHLSLAILLAGAAASLLLSLLRLPFSSLIYLAALTVFLFRTLSKNSYKRRQENSLYLGFLYRFKSRLQLQVKRLRECRTHRYFRCPQCRQMLRVPRGKGKIEVRCSRCGNKTVKKV